METSVSMGERSPRPLWAPGTDRVASSAMAAFTRMLERRTQRTYGSIAALHHYSITETAQFWKAVAEFAGMRWAKAPDAVWFPPPAGKMRGARWFPGGKLNFAENLLNPITWSPGETRAAAATPDQVVVRAYAEGTEGEKVRTLSRRDLRREVARVQRGLLQAGVSKGDRVAGVIANTPEALIAMLATSSLGAVWASCSPDFGPAAVLDRLTQIAPKVVFFTTAYVYAGKRIDCAENIRTCLSALGEGTRGVAVNHLTPETAERSLDGLTSFAEFGSLPGDASDTEPTYTACDFGDPLYILFSSGTTGVPKCIVHTVGGTLIQHKKELLLHSDIGVNGRLLYFTTCGWMMWNWMVSALATGASIVLYDGSPFAAGPRTMWDIVEREKVTAFGTSPKFIAALMQTEAPNGYVPRAHHDLSDLRTLLSTGAPLLPEQFTWIYEAVKNDLHLASISGGTDIVSCFMLGNPLAPVWPGEIQGPGLGMAIAAFDSERRPVVGAAGELVCTRAFPSMPSGFWNDPDGEKYRRAYFAHFAESPAETPRDPAAHGEVWRHGDFVEFTPRGGVIVYGRSDATLNPQGVRIGTAELYRVVETHPGIADAVAIGHKRDGDERIVLFVRMNGGAECDSAFIRSVKDLIRQKLSPRHVPAVIQAVRDIPYTRSGKKMELMVTQLIRRERVANREAVANPECLAEYEALAKQTEFA